jgi:hypothetical protein
VGARDTTDAGGERVEFRRVVLENTVVVGSKLHRYWHWGCGV